MPDKVFTLPFISRKPASHESAGEAVANGGAGEKDGGSDLFRLFALRHTFNTGVTAEEAAAELLEQRAAFETALLRAAFLTQTQKAPKGNADIGSLPYLPALFAVWFDGVKKRPRARFRRTILTRLGKRCAAR